METEKQREYAEKLLIEGLTTMQALLKARPNWYQANVLDYNSRRDLPQTPEAAYAAIRAKWQAGDIDAGNIIDSLRASRGVLAERTLGRLLGSNN